MKYLFNYKNITSDEMSLIVESLPPITTAKDKITIIEIPYRDGFLTQKEGLQEIDKKVVAHYYGKDTDRLLNWLDGNGKVIFSNQPDRFYKSYIIENVELEQIVRNILYKLTITFNCQPLGYLLEGEETITLTKSSTLYNGKSNYESLPYIKVYGTGDINLYINNKTTVLKNIDNFIEIDSEIYNCYKTINGTISNENNKLYSTFPILDIGENNISWSGNVSKVEIIPRWCCK